MNILQSTFNTYSGIYMKRILTILSVLVLLSTQCLFSRTYVLCVGVSNYGDPNVNLAQSTKDAKAFSELMKNKSRDVSLLTSSYANHDNILATLRKIADRTQEDDVIVFFYSGHGSNNMIYTYNGPVYYSEIVNILASARSKHKICFIDACLSGTVSSVLTSGGRMKYDDICFLVSSRADEYSMEHPLVGAGFLSQSLLKGIRGKADADKNRKVTMLELFKYAAYDVAKRSNDSQHPQFYGSSKMQSVVVY